MSLEPERPIEKLLRAFAKKRRAKAETSFELHPATRRLLQSEVARRFPKHSPEPPSSSWLAARLWPKLAWVLPGAMILVFGIWLLLPQSSSQKPATFLAKNEPAAASKASAVPQRSLVQEVAPASPTQPPEFRSEPSSFEFKKGDSRKDAATSSSSEPTRLQESSVRAERPRTGEEARDAERTIDTKDSLLATGTAAERETESILSARRYGLARGNVVTPASPPLESEAQGLAGASPMGAIPQPLLTAPYQDTSFTNGVFRASFAATPELRRRALLTQRSTQPNSDAKVKSALPDNAPAESSILVSFELEQSGQKLRVIDKDGSIYTGYLKAGTAPGAPPSNEPFRDFAQTAPRLIDQTAAPLSVAQDYSFGVSGTNRSLNQRVFFSGKLLEATNVSGFLPVYNVPVNGTLTIQAPGPSVQSTVSPFLNKRISGKAVIGANTQITIEAVPTTLASPRRNQE